VPEPVVLEVAALGFPWPCVDPFLFCVHHDDAYPRGNDAMGPDVPLTSRPLGQDFEKKDGFRMYHGEVVPGFPQHPHRGFETVTIVRRGLIDHSDSLGAAARFGKGDVQWLTAGRGIVHSEMFPLVDRETPNPLELFQIWLNLPRANKLVEPYFSMFWEENVPVVGREARVTVIAGALGDVRAPKPPPSSWASRPESDVAIWCITLAAGATLVLPEAASRDVRRALYFFSGSSVTIGDRALHSHSVALVRSDVEARLEAGDRPVEILMLQGRPIGEPVVQVGPFVMNTREEIRQAMLDYQRTGFGGWPWPSDAPVHPRDAGRFAKRPDGSIEQPAIRS
jgi:quercetin 2,3-dioxygenase